MEYGLWNEQVGYGRIDAYKAVLLSIEPTYQDCVEVNQITDSTHYESIWSPHFSGISVSGLNQYETYYIKIIEETKTITFPYVENPIINISTNGLSNLYSDNSCYKISNITHTSADVKLWKYKVICKNSDYNPHYMNPSYLINLYVPEESLWVNYEVFDALSSIVYITNKYIYNTTYHQTAFEKLNISNFGVMGNSNVELRAGNEIIFSPTTYIKPSSTGIVHAKAEPFVSCESNRELQNEASDLLVNESMQKAFYEDDISKDVNNIEENIIPVVLFPNPAKDEIIVQYNKSMENRGIIISISSSSGDLIDEIKTNSIETPINISHYANGYYIVKVKAPDEVYRKIFIKR